MCNNMWIVVFFVLSVAADSCDQSKNDADNINEDCNFAGMCFANQCWCCDTTNEGDFCGGAVPGKWAGDTCSSATYFTAIQYGYLVDGNITCANDGTSAAVPNMMDMTLAILGDYYDGMILEMPCKICTPADPCSFFTDNPPTSKTFVKFGTDLNTYYDLGCSKGNIPESIRKCDANWDNGAAAYMHMQNGLDKEGEYTRHLNELEVLADAVSIEVQVGIGGMWHEIVKVDQLAVQTTRLPTPAPTPVPSSASPTSGPTSKPYAAEEELICADYINSVSDLRFLNAGSSCRANINESWTGGRTCESPYIICLPQENTPTTDMMGNPYKNDTYRYSVPECLQECSYDQRCLGIEFVADANSNRGDCNLIDDIPVEVENPDYGYNYNDADVSLDSNTTGGDALCWAKADYCNPHFEADDLNDIMLNCYCPNNRKGFYTKKVQRIVNNTVYCSNDSRVEERIKKAQANRMFHLCENWCLFDTLNPEGESWYWDPWKKCWRETYSGHGEHTGYCDRVIRNPDSIEMKFLSSRAENFLSPDCDASAHPTLAPVSDPYNWTLSEKGDSCDDACSALGGRCAEEATATIFSTEAELTSAFAAAGHTCDSTNIQMIQPNWEGWALPGLRGQKHCGNRQPAPSHLENLDTGCNRVIGTNWQRLCACYDI